MSVEHFSQVITLCRSAWAANIERPAELQTDDLMKKLTPFDVQFKIAIFIGSDRCSLLTLITSLYITTIVMQQTNSMKLFSHVLVEVTVGKWNFVKFL